MSWNLRIYQIQNRQNKVLKRLFLCLNPTSRKRHNPPRRGILVQRYNKKMKHAIFLQKKLGRKCACIEKNRTFAANLERCSIMETKETKQERVNPAWLAAQKYQGSIIINDPAWR